jgi:hypothetical protein
VERVDFCTAVDFVPMCFVRSVWDFIWTHLLHK